MILFAAAAGGGVVVLIIVVMVVVLARRSRTPAAKKPKTSAADKRAVVAFENPMYATTAESKQEGASTYDEHAQGMNPSEGLYDEPAFNNKSDKENPLYESTENLAAEPKQNIYGYDDDAPLGGPELDNGNMQFDEANRMEDSGYLDVND
jgi:hypothetical protein